MTMRESSVRSRMALVCALGAVVALGAAGLVAGDAAADTSDKAVKAGKADWAMNATIIEACSCPMFCTCYFNSEPAAHHGHHGGEEHFCKFNNAYRVNRGHHGATKLDGAKFWIAGDLGDEFGDGEMKWAVLHFDESVSAEQRAAIQEIVGHVYPVKWSSFAVGPDAKMEWKAGKDRAEARLDGGKTAEVVLVRGPGMDDTSPVIRNLKYWGVPRNDGFVLMPNQVEAYRAGDEAFEFKGTNGFMITFDIASSDVAPAAAAKKKS